MTSYYLIEPFEPITIRGNRSFGSSADHGESAMPPWPSVFAGALRSAILGHDSKALTAFTARHFELDGEIGRVLGTPEVPGDFRLAWASLALQQTEQWIPVLPAPADLVITKGKKPRLLEPEPMPVALGASTFLPLVAIDRTDQSAKPSVGHWIAGEDLARYLRAEAPHGTLTTANIFKSDMRIGIELDGARRTASEGQIYSTEAVSLHEETGFLVGIDGLDGEGSENLLPKQGTLRLGGDGRAAEYRRVPAWQPPALLERIQHDKRFRLVLAAPAIFQQGWLPDRVVSTGGAFRLDMLGFSARLAAASVARYQTVSGWDLARWKPKPASRVAPAGSVYWFDQLEGDPRKLAEWVATGLWSQNSDRQRQVEGFNCAMLAAWPIPRENNHV